MTLKEAMKRIEALEAEILKLKALPRIEYHHHYHPPQQPTYSPLFPTFLPLPNTMPQLPTVWCHSGIGHGGNMS